MDEVVLMDEWVERAQAGEDGRPALMQSYYIKLGEHWFFACSDSFRIHAARKAAVPEVDYALQLTDGMWVARYDDRFALVDNSVHSLAKGESFQKQCRKLDDVAVTCTLYGTNALWREAAVAVQCDDRGLGRITLSYGSGGIKTSITDDIELSGNLIAAQFNVEVPKLLVQAQYLCDALAEARKTNATVDLRWIPVSGGMYMLGVGDPLEYFALIMPMRNEE